MLSRREGLRASGQFAIGGTAAVDESKKIIKPNPECRASLDPDHSAPIEPHVYPIARRNLTYRVMQAKGSLLKNSCPSAAVHFGLPSAEAQQSANHGKFNLNSLK